MSFESKITVGTLPIRWFKSPPPLHRKAGVAQVQGGFQHHLRLFLNGCPPNKNVLARYRFSKVKSPNECPFGRKEFPRSIRSIWLGNFNLEDNLKCQNTVDGRNPAPHKNPWLKHVEPIVCLALTLGTRIRSPNFDRVREAEIRASRTPKHQRPIILVGRKKRTFSHQSGPKKSILDPQNSNLKMGLTPKIMG